MTNAFRRVRPGEPVKIAATAWNQVIDQVRVRPQFAAEASDVPQVNHRVRVRNFTTGPIDRWGVLQINAMLETPTGTTGPAADSFQSWPGVVGVVPGQSDPDGPVGYVVAVEPIAAGEIGQGAIAGVIQSRMVVRCTGHRYARPVKDQVGYMESADAGPFRQLWRGTGVSGVTGAWSLLMFGTESDPTKLPDHSTGAVQLLGHGKPTTGASGCDGGLRWYSVTECSGNPSYASSYFL
jgi:hypothetical protein